MRVDHSTFRREVLEAPGPVLSMFYAEWCPFCLRLKPRFEAFARRPGWGQTRFVMVDISDPSSPLWEEYNIGVVPTLILFFEGGPAGRADGILGKGLDENAIAELAEKARSLAR